MAATVELSCALRHVYSVFSKRTGNEAGDVPELESNASQMWSLHHANKKLQAAATSVADFPLPKNHELLQTYQLARLFTNHRSGAEGHWSVVKIVARAD